MTIDVMAETYGTAYWGEDAPYVNMANGRASSVFSVLGLDLAEMGWCGSEDAETFLGRVMLAQAIAPQDEGMPAYEHHREPGQVGALMIEGARTPGYLQMRLQQIREVAEWASARNLHVQWG